jgi:murein DD-endopeptidase MepM/ murein hydrolase activator NlpD
VGVLLTLAACASEPQYPVRPGAPRVAFELPKPTYPVKVQPAPEPAAPSPTRPPLREDAPPAYRPEPIADAPPPPDQADLPLRGRQSPESRAAIASAPVPALETPPQTTVRPGETLFELAERVRTPVQAIVEANHLEPPYDVTPGDVLKIPPPVVYVVKSGDTWSTIGRRFSIDPRSLASLNDLAFDGALVPGERLALPSGASESGVRPLAQRPAISPHPRPVAVEPLARAAVVVSPVAEPSAAKTTPPPPRVRFAWPIKGAILSAYGPKGPGQRNDGVNIAANEGDPVKAAASGQVVYAGNSIPGFGNLVVLKHPDGWTSLYGNLARIAVKIRAEVEEGQTLGVAGSAGGTDRAQVHFEVRYAASPQEKARPVDPQTVLP